MDAEGEKRLFEPSLSAIREARLFVRSSLEGRGMDLDDLTSIVSELATNAVTHARSRFYIQLFVNSAVRVEVSDENPRLPRIEEPAPGALSGRGLPLVNALASRWGVTPLQGNGKTIWAEVDFPAQRSVGPK